MILTTDHWSLITRPYPFPRSVSLGIYVWLKEFCFFDVCNGYQP